MTITSYNFVNISTMMQCCESHPYVLVSWWLIEVHMSWYTFYHLAINILHCTQDSTKRKILKEYWIIWKGRMHLGIDFTRKKGWKDNNQIIKGKSRNVLVITTECLLNFRIKRADIGQQPWERTRSMLSSVLFNLYIKHLIGMAELKNDSWDYNCRMKC